MEQYGSGSHPGRGAWDPDAVPGRSFDLDLVDLQQAGEAMNGKFRFADAVRFRGNRVIERRPEVGILEVGMKKERLTQIAVSKRGSAQVGIREIRLPEVAIGKLRISHVKPVEYREFKHAAFELHPEQQLPAADEIQAKQFGINETHLLQAGSCEFRQTDVAAFESAVPEDHS